MSGLLTATLGPTIGSTLRGIADKGAGGGLQIVSQNAMAAAVTFTRQSIAYEQVNGVLQSVGNDIPRYESSLAGAYLGLLIERGSTNLALYSQDFTQSWWVKTTGGTGTAPTITANYATAPDGTMTADRAVFNIATGTTSADISNLGSATLTGLTSGSIYGSSIWAKTNDGTTITMTMVAPDTSLKTITITPQWKRYSYSAVVSSTSFQGVRIRLRGNEGTSKSADISVWQGQFEAGVASSDIQTSSSTASRFPDNASALLTDIPISTVAGTFVVSHDVPLGNPLLYSGSNKILDSAGGSKVAIGYDVSGVSISIDGAVVTTGSALTWSTTLDILKSSTAYGGGHVKSIVWYASKFDDYALRATSAPPDLGVFVSGDTSTKTFKVVLPFGTNMLRVTLKPNGFNSLFNFASIEKAPKGDPATAVWTALGSAFTTDWIPPIFVRAANNGDGTTPGFYTGGNHGTNGDASGSNTAVSGGWSCEVDGRVLGSSESISRYAAKVTWTWNNLIYAYNTCSFPRVSVNQSISMSASEYGFTYDHVLTPLEDVVFGTIYCGGTTSPGFTDSCHYYDGQAQARQLAADVTDSGHKSAAPNAWAAVTGGTDGFHSLWMDRTYGWGDGRALDASSPVLRINTGFWKFYTAVVSTDTPVSADQSIPMRGGYSWAPASMSSGIDSSWTFNSNGQASLAWSLTSAGSGLISTPQQWGRGPVNGVNIGANGLAVSASGYITRGFRVPS